MNPKAKSFKPGIRKSKYDKYEQQIIDLCSKGLSAIEIMDKFEEIYEEYDITQSGLYNYIKTRNIKHLSRKSLIHTETICDGCEWCEELEMCNGNINRFCMLSKKQIFRTTTTSPMWCKK
jgi:hypothetical protein